MSRLLLTVVAAFAFTQSPCFANDAVPSGHSTVSIVFITSQPPTQGGGAIGSAPMARVGDMFVPTDSIRPIAITIDGDFVGHALVGHWDIKPVFVLPEGTRKFSFTVDGSEPINTELKVLGTGSMQYLIVKLPADGGTDVTAAASGDASSVQSSRN